MFSKFAIGGIVAVLLGLIAIGAVSAAGGPIALTHNSAPHRGNQQDDQDDKDEDNADNDQDADVDEADESAANAETGNDGVQTAQNENETGAGAQHVAQVIADEFGVGQADVLALHDQGIGFGALFKLYAIARAKGMSVNDLLATLTNDNGGHNFAFGKLMAGLTDEQRASLEAGPKNLGELVSASHKAEGGAAATSEGTSGPAGHGAEVSSTPGRGHGHQN